MSKQDSDRWNTRYAQGAYQTRSHPSELLVRWLPRVQQTLSSAAGAPKCAWDVACGAGRNTLYLAQQAYSVTGIDISSAGLEQAAQRMAAQQQLTPELALNWRFVEHDLESATLPDLGPPPSVIVVFRYLNLALVPQLLRSLSADGWLFVEVHLQTEDNAPPVGGPSSDRFRAAPGELAQILTQPDIKNPLPPFAIEYANEGLVVDPDGSTMALAQLVVRRTG